MRRSICPCLDKEDSQQLAYIVKMQAHFLEDLCNHLEMCDASLPYVAAAMTISLLGLCPSTDDSPMPNLTEKETLEAWASLKARVDEMLFETGVH